MIKAIVTSTINAPTRAIRLFEAMPDWHIIVVGDLKTPDYKLKNGTYLSPAEQLSYDKELSNAIGWGVYQRANFGLLLAYDMGAEVVALVNDDNIPYPLVWGENLMLGRETRVNYYETDLPAFDPVGATNYPHLWHRGFPLSLLPQRRYQRTHKILVPQVQADFWDGDPDIDAICRMEHAPVCHFNERRFPIASNKPSPFDCQNTFMLREVLKDYFLFPGVGRMDDIWASYYAQSKGHRPVYGAPSVFHDRGPHDLIRDMQNEYRGYESNLRLVQDLAVDPDRIKQHIPSTSIRAFELYRRHFS